MDLGCTLSPGHNQDLDNTLAPSSLIALQILIALWILDNRGYWIQLKSWPYCKVLRRFHYTQFQFAILVVHQRFIRIKSNKYLHIQSFYCLIIPNTSYISLTPCTNYRAKTDNNVSVFTHSNWITQSYYSSPKYKSPLHRYLIHFSDFCTL